MLDHPREFRGCPELDGTGRIARAASVYQSQRMDDLQIESRNAFSRRDYLARVRKNRPAATSRARWQNLGCTSRASRVHLEFRFSHPPFFAYVQFSSFSMGALDARSINPFRRENISTRLPVSARKRNVSFPSFLEPSRRCRLLSGLPPPRSPLELSLDSSIYLAISRPERHPDYSLKEPWSRIFRNNELIL